MKLTIEKKLVISFLCIALLVLLSGLVGVIVVNMVSGSADMVAKEKAPVQYAVMQANNLVGRIKEAITSYIFATNNLDEKEKNILSLLDEFDMWITMLKLGTESDTFQKSKSGDVYKKNNLKIIVPKGSIAILAKVENVLKEIATFRTSTNELMLAHNEYLSYSITFEDKNYDLPSYLRILNEYHLNWIKSLQDAINAIVLFKGATDAKNTLIYKWINTYSVNDKFLMKLLSKMRKYHQKLIKYAVAINSKETYKQKMKYFNRSKGATARINETFGKMHTHIKPIYLALEKTKQKKVTALNQSANKITENLNLLVIGAEIEMAEALVTSEKIKATGYSFLIILTIAAVIIAMILGIIISRYLTKDITALADITKEIAAGNLQKTVDIKSKDELGELAKDTNTMMENLKNMIGQVTDYSTKLTQSSHELSTLSASMSDGATNMTEKSKCVSAAAEEMSTNMNMVAVTCEEAATNVNSVSIASEEINSSINEIRNNSGKGRTITLEAVSRAESATEKVDELGNSAKKISKVTELISDISDQTNLLALNATIEAARAGESGKGFAVVASEIKALSIQTAEATNDIKNRIMGIQNNTSETIEEIKGVSQIIESVNQIVETIATSVEEQSATANEISMNMGQTSKGLHEVNKNVAQSSSVSHEIAQDIGNVNIFSQKLYDSSHKVKNNASNLKNFAAGLQEIVNKFKL